MKAEKLMREAGKAAENAYAPYSRFRVGAALQMGDGTVITGVNVENRSFGLSNCAERSAIFTAISQGKKDIRGIAIAGPDAWEPLPPCGACRQVISEFCPPETPIYYDDGKGGFITSSVGVLYPANSLMDMAEKKN
jgi:cytidine deaminase